MDGHAVSMLRPTARATCGYDRNTLRWFLFGGRRAWASQIALQTLPTEWMYTYNLYIYMYIMLLGKLYAIGLKWRRSEVPEPGTRSGEASSRFWVKAIRNHNHHHHPQFVVVGRPIMGLLCGTCWSRGFALFWRVAPARVASKGHPTWYQMKRANSHNNCMAIPIKRATKSLMRVWPVVTLSFQVLV